MKIATGLVRLTYLQASVELFIVTSEVVKVLMFLVFGVLKRYVDFIHSTHGTNDAVFTV